MRPQLLENIFWNIKSEIFLVLAQSEHKELVVAFQEESDKFKATNRKKIEERDLKKLAPQQRSRYMAVSVTAKIWKSNKKYYMKKYQKIFYEKVSKTIIWKNNIEYTDQFSQPPKSYLWRQKLTRYFLSKTGIIS